MKCSDCNGTGSKVYGSTATYHGGCGGAAMTRDVCNKCWGSGDHDNPNPDPRKVTSPGQILRDSDREINGRGEE